MSKLSIKWNPTGFAECLQGTAGELQSAAESIASRASSYLENGSGCGSAGQYDTGSPAGSLSDQCNLAMNHPFP